MSISSTNYTSSQKLPGITVVTPVKISELVADNIIQHVYDGPSAVAFNKAIQTYKTDIYCFMSHETIMLDAISLIDTVIKTYDRYQFINCIYTDNLYQEYRQYLSSINPALLINHGVVIETPLFVRNVQPFNENINILCCYEMLLKLASTTVTYHLPMIGFKTNIVSLRPPQSQVEKELRIIYEQSR